MPAEPPDDLMMLSARDVVLEIRADVKALARDVGEIKTEQATVALELAHTAERFVTIEEARRIAALEIDRRLGEMAGLRDQIRDDVKALLAAEQRRAGSEEGSRRSLAFFAPSMPSVVAMLVGLVSLGISLVVLVAR